MPRPELTRVHAAITRRLKDSHGRPIRLSLRKLAAEENLNGRQARRALLRLAELERLTIEEHGDGGEITVGPAEEPVL